MKQSVLLVALHLTLIHLLSSYYVVSAFSSPSPKNDKHDSVPPPPPNQTPDERQKRMLEKMGYTWNGRAWVRGDAKAYAQQRATARSSNRYIRLLDATDRTPIATPSAVAAAKRLSEVLQRARKDAMPERNEKQLARDRDFKNFVAKKEAPLIWLSAELAVFVALCQIRISVPYSTTTIGINWGDELQQLLANPTLILGLGLLSGFVLSFSRTRQLIPGMEEPDGKLVRILADTMAEKDAIALPASNHVRYPNTKWKVLAFVGEALAAVNVSILMNGLLQPLTTELPNLWKYWMFSDQVVWDAMAIDTTSVPELAASTHETSISLAIIAALLVALPAAARSAKHYDTPIDGICAECKDLRKSKDQVGAYFNMNPNLRKTGADPIEATAIYRELANGWLEKFETAVDDNDGIQLKQGLLAFGGSLACALSYQLSYQSIFSPLFARIVAAADIYLRQDRKESSRKSVLMNPDETASSQDASLQ